MHTRTRVFLAFALGLILGVAAVVSAQAGRADTFKITTDTAGNVLSTTEVKTVPLTSQDLGLKVVGRRNGRVVGKLMAKVDGQWVEVQLAPQDSFVRQ
jgi:hypothetical protein